MGLRIQQLPPAIANQIAAGEVIERPASIVKELLENAYDAAADAISVEIGYGGLNLIKIADNGSGIMAEDLALALAAHATSKISKLDDLYAIDSMGFRGEALASIASIAKVSISSKPKDQEHAMLISNQQLQITACARTVGTTVEVKDIFYNAPVRKRFLKGEKIEFQAIEMVIKRFALSAPHIAISVKHNNKPVLNLPAAVNDQAKITRMAKIFGSPFMHDAMVVDVEHAGMSLYGWISGTNYQRSQNDRQWVYINQRMVKDKLLNHALKQAYDGLLHPGRFPACLLYFSIPSKEVDVNVHPTKHEVRFAQPRLVHDFFSSQIGKALQTTKEAPVQVIQEPYPLFTPMNNSTAFQLPKIEDQDQPWIVLNRQYVLAFVQQLPHLVDVLALHQQSVLAELTASPLPLAARPLLVPINLPVPANKPWTELQQALATVGIQLECIQETSLSCKSMPILSPHLDLRRFWDRVLQLDSYQIQELIQCISQCQSIDPRMIATEERWHLHQFLISSKNTHPVCKVLTEDDCRMLLHV